MPNDTNYHENIQFLLKHLPNSWAKTLGARLGIKPHTLRSYARGDRQYPEKQIMVYKQLVKMYTRQQKEVRLISSIVHEKIIA